MISMYCFLIILIVSMIVWIPFHSSITGQQILTNVDINRKPMSACSFCLRITANVTSHNFFYCLVPAKNKIQAIHQVKNTLCIIDIYIYSYRLRKCYTLVNKDIT